MKHPCDAASNEIISLIEANIEDEASPKVTLACIHRESRIDGIDSELVSTMCMVHVNGHCISSGRRGKQRIITVVEADVEDEASPAVALACIFGERRVDGIDSELV